MSIAHSCFLASAKYNQNQKGLFRSSHKSQPFPQKQSVFNELSVCYLSFQCSNLLLEECSIKLKKYFSEVL